MNLDDVLAEINEFLLCPTPAGWIDVALDNQELLLIDHANCEKKSSVYSNESFVPVHRSR